MKYRRLNLTQVEELASQISQNRDKYGRILGLVGPLGAGKTAFTKALTRSLGIRQAKSPSFVIVNCYEGQKNSLYHIDLYRLEKTAQLKALGLDEILANSENLVIIEWADKFPNLLKKCDTIIEFEILPQNLRNVTVTSN